MAHVFNRIRDENPEAREALRALIRRMRQERLAAYIFVNNRLEGNAPDTIRAKNKCSDCRTMSGK